MVMMKLTKVGIKGEIIPPQRAHTEDTPKPMLRTQVGKSSVE